MACCPTVPSNHQNQSWLIIYDVLWHSPESNFTGRVHTLNTKHVLVINRHFQNGETTCCQLSKRLPDNSTIFAAEATAISLVLNYYQHMDPVHHDVVIYPDSMSCLQATEEVPAPNQSWRGCNHPTSNLPYQGHQIPYLVPRTANWLSPLWSNTDHWPYAAGVCIVTGMSWWILHSRLVECSLLDNSWDLHSRVPARSGIFLSDMM